MVIFFIYGGNMKYITCPNCGAEYAPCEIFMPDSFLGKSKFIEKDIQGKIIFNDSDMCLDESYTCDKCNAPFKVFAKVSFASQPDTVHDFTSDYSTPLKKTTLFMKED